MTPNDTIVADEELIKKEDNRFHELSNKKETLTPEETKELGELKDKYSQRVQKRIDKLTWETKSTKEELEKERQERERLQAELDEVKKGKSKDTKIDLAKQTIEIEGEKFYTDEALLVMVKSGDITEDEAWKHQRKRDKAEIRADVLRDIKTSREKETNEELRKKDANWVLEHYPHFSKDHKDFNPEDPLYKKTIELYSEAYAARPDGLSKAIGRAKEILRISDTPVDRSGELGIEASEANSTRSAFERKANDITLTEAEKNWAISMYCRGDVVNPKTGKPYTEQEGLAKALEAKKARIKR